MKCHDFFSFDKVIYADMFLFKNQEKANQVREDIERMKLKLYQINQELKSYKNFGNQGELETQF